MGVRVKLAIGRVFTVVLLDKGVLEAMLLSVTRRVTVFKPEVP
jgi:hypothetical protein